MMQHELERVPPLFPSSLKTPGNFFARRLSINGKEMQGACPDFFIMSAHERCKFRVRSHHAPKSKLIASSEPSEL
jgi:hypothetical protein